MLPLPSALFSRIDDDIDPEPDVRVIPAPVPAVTDPTDAVVKVTGTTVCGSDLHLYHKELFQLKRGEILGHEWMGIIDEVGPEVKNFKKGDRVVASFQIGYVVFSNPILLHSSFRGRVELMGKNVDVDNANSANKTLPPCATEPTPLRCKKNCMDRRSAVSMATRILLVAMLEDRYKGISERIIEHR